MGEPTPELRRVEPSDVGRFGLIWRLADSTVPDSVLVGELLPGPEVATALMDRDARLGALQHPLVGRLRQIREQGGEWLAIREASEGVSLSRLLEEALPPTVAVALCRKVARALHTAFDRSLGAGEALGLVHGDLGPDVISVGTSGQVQVLSLGLLPSSKPRPRDPARAWLLHPSFTTAPEQLGGVDLHASDVYALGALLAWMVTGEPPHQAKRSVSRHGSQVRALARRVGKIGGDPALGEIVKACMALAPDDRPSAVVVEGRLDGLALSTGTPGLEEWANAQVPEAVMDARRDAFSASGLGLQDDLPPDPPTALLEEGAEPDLGVLASDVLAQLDAGMVEPALSETSDGTLDEPSSSELSPPRSADENANFGRELRAAAQPETRTRRRLESPSGPVTLDSSAVVPDDPSDGARLAGLNSYTSEADHGTSVPEFHNPGGSWVSTEWESTSMEVVPPEAPLDVEELVQAPEAPERLWSPLEAGPSPEEGTEGPALLPGPPDPASGAALPPLPPPEPTAPQWLAEAPTVSAAPTPDALSSAPASPPAPASALPPASAAPRTTLPDFRPMPSPPPTRPEQPPVVMVVGLAIAVLLLLWWIWPDREQDGPPPPPVAVLPAVEPQAAPQATAPPPLSAAEPIALEEAPAEVVMVEAPPPAQPPAPPVVEAAPGAKELPDEPVVVARAPTASREASAPAVSTPAATEPEPGRVATAPPTPAPAPPSSPPPTKVPAAPAVAPTVSGASTGQGHFVVEGDAADVALVREGRSWQPGDLPPGTYQIRVVFREGGVAQEMGTVRLVSEQTVTVRCRASFLRCNAQ